MPSSTPPKRVTRPRSTKPTAVPAAPTASAALQPAALNQDSVALRAYHLWLAEGRPDGRALEHWTRAQSELA